MPLTIVSHEAGFKPIHSQSEWSSDESPEDKILPEEHRLKRRPNLKAGVGDSPLLIYCAEFTKARNRISPILKSKKSSHITKPHLYEVT